MLEQLLTVILVSIVLGADAFSLSMGMGLRGVSASYEKRFSLMVGVFHIFMPLIGLNLGLVAGKFLGIWAGRLGAIVLLYIGTDMLLKSYKETRPRSYKFAEGRKLFAKPEKRNAEWINLVLLSTTVSIDALTVGFSLGTLQMPVVYTVVIMGSTAGTMTFMGFKGGRLFNRAIGSYAKLLGGVVLLGLALKMLLLD